MDILLYGIYIYILGAFSKTISGSRLLSLLNLVIFIIISFAVLLDNINPIGQKYAVAFTSINYILIFVNIGYVSYKTDNNFTELIKLIKKIVPHK